MDPHEPVSSSIPEITDIARRAEEAKARLQRVASTVTSNDGAATVTVNVSGALQQLTFGPKADEIPRGQLAASVLATAHRAQAQAAQQLTAVMAPLIGTDSEAMRFLEEQIPAPAVAEGEPSVSAAPHWDFTSEQDDVPPPAAPRPPQPDGPNPADGDGHEDDDGGDSVLQRGW